MPDLDRIHVRVQPQNAQRVECLVSVDRSLWSQPDWRNALTRAILRAFERYEDDGNDGMEAIAERLGLTVGQVQSIVDDVLLACALRSPDILATMLDSAIVRAEAVKNADLVNLSGPEGAINLSE